jgi:hypothetical protein
MDCKEFRNIVADLFDKDVDPRIKTECEKHISQCAECRAYYEDLLSTAELLRPKHSPVSKSERIKPNSASLLYKIAASFIGIIMLSGIAVAAYRAISPKQTADATEQKKPEKKDIGSMIKISDNGKLFVTDWPRGAWIVTDDDSYIEGRSHRAYNFYWVDGGDVSVKLNGVASDIHQLAEKPASNVTKVEMHDKDRHLTIDFITAPVRIPANVQYNINPELTILLTGTPPKDAKIKSSVYIKEGIHDSFDWKQYMYSSWTATDSNINMRLEEVALRKEHYVQINVCKGVSQEQINRLKKLIQENGVTNYKLIQQQ